MKYSTFGIAGLILVVVVISLMQSLAQPAPTEIAMAAITEKTTLESRQAKLAPYNLIPMVVGNGFAFADEEFHVVKLNVFGIRKLAFHEIRSMIAERKNLSQIKEALLSSEPVWRGYLKFGTKHFTLKVEKIDNKHLNAQILWYPSLVDVESNSSVKPSVVGNLSLEIKFYEGAIIGTGNITFNSTALQNKNTYDTYDIYLYISPDRPYIEPVLKSIISQ
jgi:hypothetical protein